MKYKDRNKNIFFDYFTSADTINIRLKLKSLGLRYFVIYDQIRRFYTSVLCQIS